FGELPPEGNVLRLIGLALPERRLLRIVVVDVRVLALAAGCCVQIEDEVHLVLPDPLEQGIHHLEALLAPRDLARHGLLLDGRRKPLVVHGEADRVESPRLHRVDVDFSRVVRQPGLIELLLPVLSDERLDVGFDHVLGPARAQHVALLQHPSPEADAAKQDLVAVGVHDARAVGSEELSGSGGGSEGDRRDTDSRCDKDAMAHGWMTILVEASFVARSELNRDIGPVAGWVVAESTASCRQQITNERGGEPCPRTIIPASARSRTASTLAGSSI